jgi:hypothetical protein
MVQHRRLSLSLGPIFGTILAAALIAGCVSAPQYDATTDARLSALQQNVDEEFVTLISLARSKTTEAKNLSAFDKAVPFYNKVDTDLTSLELRMEAVTDPSTAKLPIFFSTLHREFDEIRDKHEKEGVLDEGFLKYTRAQMNAQFAVLLTYELSLKGVPSPKQATHQQHLNQRLGQGRGQRPETRRRKAVRPAHGC